MSTKAVLIVADDFRSRVRVKLEVEMSLEDAAKLSQEIAAVEGKSWDLRFIGETIEQLRRQAEEAIEGLKFEQDTAA